MDDSDMSGTEYCEEDDEYDLDGNVPYSEWKRWWKHFVLDIWKPSVDRKSKNNDTHVEADGGDKLNGK